MLNRTKQNKECYLFEADNYLSEARSLMSQLSDLKTYNCKTHKGRSGPAKKRKENAEVGKTTIDTKDIEVVDYNEVRFILAKTMRLLTFLQEQQAEHGRIYKQGYNEGKEDGINDIEKKLDGVIIITFVLFVALIISLYILKGG